MMVVWIKVDPDTERIAECKWRTFGCASAIASTSISSESMSTTVPIPVRVKPPPAETGETISPTWASFVTMIPSYGA